MLCLRLSTRWTLTVTRDGRVRVRTDRRWLVLPFDPADPDRDDDGQPVGSFIGGAAD